MVLKTLYKTQRVLESRSNLSVHVCVKRKRMALVSFQAPTYVCKWGVFLFLNTTQQQILFYRLKQLMCD